MVISRKRKCVVVVFISLLISAQNLLAQTQVLTLKNLVDASQINQPSILKKQAQVNSSKAAIVDAKHTALPSLKLNDQVSLASANSETGTYFPLGNIVSTSGAIRAQNNYQAASGNIVMAYSEYELANFGLNKARVEDAQVYNDLNKADLSKDLYLAKLSTARYYFYLLKAYHELEIEQNNVKRYETLFTIISAQVKSGLKPGSDSSQAKAELSKARATYNIKAGEIAQLKEELALLTSIPETSINVDTSLEKYSELINRNLNRAVSVDTSYNPLIDYYNKQKNLYISKNNLIKKSYLPKILLAGGFWGRGTSIDDKGQYKALPSGLGYQRFNYGVALAFTYNLFDGIHRNDKLAINKYQIQQSDYELQQQKLELNTSLQKSQTAIDVIDKNLKELPIQLTSANDLYMQKSAQYQAGVSNLVDLTNAAFLLYQVESDNIQIQTDWFLANLDKAAAEGNLEQFIQTIK
jgi:outer membrane protein TolC